jgi:hypothetical protein
VLTDDQRADLATTGHTVLPGAVDRATAAEMEDAVWRLLGRRGIERGDPATWPVGSMSKLQGLRSAQIFDRFGSDAVRSVTDELLEPGRWHPQDSWGPALVTFPQPGPWVLPHKIWHFDLPGRGDPDRHHVARLFGFATDVRPQGGGTLVVEGSHELVRRLVRDAPGHQAGSSSDLRKRLVRRHRWFQALCSEGGDRTAQFMVDGDEIDGVRVRVAELTGDAGDVALMLPWTMHNASPNTGAGPRFMVTHSYLRYDNPFYAAQATGSDATA